MRGNETQNQPGSDVSDLGVSVIFLSSHLNIRKLFCALGSEHPSISFFSMFESRFDLFPETYSLLSTPKTSVHNTLCAEVSRFPPNLSPLLLSLVLEIAFLPADLNWISLLTPFHSYYKSPEFLLRQLGCNSNHNIKVHLMRNFFFKNQMHFMMKLREWLLKLPGATA